MDDQVEGAVDLLPDGPHRQFDAGHQDQRLEPRERVARAVRVDRGHGALVAGVHGLQHVERLAAAHLPNDHPVGTHPNRMPDELSQGDGLFGAG